MSMFGDIAIAMLAVGIVVAAELGCARATRKPRKEIDADEWLKQWDKDDDESRQYTGPLL
jgi:hypothetical protein